MAAPKRSTHVVVHQKLYMAPKGKLEHIKAGTELVLDKKTAKALGAKVKAIGEEKAVDLTGNGTDFSKMKVEELKAELDKREVTYPDDAKKADLLKLLEVPAE